MTMNFAIYKYPQAYNFITATKNRYINKKVITNL